MSKQTNFLKIIQLNCRSLGSPDKQTELIHFIQKHDPDIMLLSETFLKTKHRLIIPNNYSLYRTDRIGRGGGGTAIIIKTKIKHKLITGPETLSFPDSTTIKVKCYGRSYIISSIYSTKLVLENDLNSFFNLGERVFIGGDFNSKHTSWYCTQNNSSGTNIYNFINKYENIDMHFPDDYTHFPDNQILNPSVIDFSLTKNINIFNKPITIDDFHSDHRAISYIVPLNSTYKINNTPKIKLNFSKANWEMFRAHIDLNIDHNVLITSKEDIDKGLQHLVSTINEGIEIYVPKISNKNGTLPPPDFIIDLIQRRNILRRNCRNSANPQVLKCQINMVTKYIKYSLNKIRDRELEAKLEAIPPNSRNLFQPIGKLYRLDRPSYTLPPLVVDNGFIHNIREKSNYIGKHFESVSTLTAANSSFAAHDTQINNDVSDYFNTFHNPQLRTPQTTPKELKSIIKNLKNKKAPGNDNLNNITLKNLPKKALILLAKITNAILKFGYFPKNWKCAKVIPIPKPGKIPNNPLHLRPISLLSALSKVVEKIILIHLTQHLDDQHVIQDEQFGFRTSHSTTHALTRIVELITKGFNRKETTVGVFLDTEKAFDKVWHSGLLYKLIQIKTPFYLINLLKSYLLNRTFNVHLGNTVSDTFSINAGVPQGSLLGPILYIIYTYDLPTTNRTFSSVYADDNAIFCTSLNAKNACKHLQAHINLLNVYNSKWKLKINASKSEAMVFTTRRRGPSRRNSEINLKYNEDVIKYSKSVKYLGLKLTRKLNFAEHTKFRIELAKKAMSMLYPVIKIDSGLNVLNKIRIYAMYLRPIFTYAAPVWMTMSESLKKLLQTIQNKCLRMAINFKLNLNNNRYISNIALHKKTKVPLLKDYLQSVINKSFKEMSTSTNVLVQSLGQFDLDYYSNNRFKPPHYSYI